MNAQRMTRVMLAGAVALALTALTVLIVALPATAGPEAQDSWTPIPTPTLAPLGPEGIQFVWEVVPPDDSPRTVSGETVDGVTFGETTVESRYPEGMDFQVAVDTDAEIERVNLVIQDVNDLIAVTQRSRWDESRAAWTVFLDTDRHIMPLWTPFDFAWCVIDTNDRKVCTDYHSTEFWDPTQEWFRMENEWARVYWYGFGEDNPEHIAREFALATASAHQRRVDAFGRDISYPMVLVLYPDVPGVPSSYGGNYRFGVMYGPLVVNDPDWRETRYYLLSPYGDELTTDDWVTIQSSVANIQLAYFLAYDILMRDYCGDNLIFCANVGPDAWVYGQAIWASIPTWDYDQRIRDLAASQSIPGFRRLNWDDDLAFPVGASFINWLIYHYGIETHRQIVELMIPTEDDPRGMDFYDAIEQATGKPFDDLENEWRAYLELPPLE